MNAEEYVSMGWYFQFEEFEDKSVLNKNGKPRRRHRVILVSPDGDVFYSAEGDTPAEAAALVIQKANIVDQDFESSNEMFIKSTQPKNARS